MQIKITFLGAAQNVTGSRYLVQTNGTTILVDCGLYQEREFADRNWDPFPIAPQSIDAVLLTHAHLDHCGLIPKLVKEGFAGKIYATDATAEIAQIVLLDSGHLQEEDAAFKIKRHKKQGHTPPRPVQPLYTVEDAAACEAFFAPVRYNQETKVAEGISATFYDAGHILGSSMVKVRVQADGQKRTILFSGDVGRWDRPILRDPTCFEHADYIVTESTYGDRLHETVTDIKDRLSEVILDAQASRGNIVIPSFSIERSQDILYYLNEIVLEERVPPITTFLDSPMAIAVTKVFQDHPEMFDRQMNHHIENNHSPFNLPGLTMTRTTNESKAINTISGTAIIIAGSGMCTGGRVKHHLVNNISRPECTILFPGYQARGTLGRIILEGAKEVRILGQIREVKAKIVRIHGFSGHADRDELCKWLGCVDNSPKRVFITHGETEVAQSFAKHVHEKFGWETSVPSYKESVVLD
ncbi:MAG: MBL fold metallo-hydrolase [Sedimentisphaerales bacterium]|nr:MBL fold metallo-hydrolase [Sedimentisphaerales bacterium]